MLESQAAAREREACEDETTSAFCRSRFFVDPGALGVIHRHERPQSATQGKLQSNPVYQQISKHLRVGAKSGRTKQIRLIIGHSDAHHDPK